MKKKEFEENDNENPQGLTASKGAEEVQQTGFLGFVERNRVFIMVASVVIVLLAGGLYYMQYQAEINEEKASVLLSRALTLYEDREFDLALNGDPNQQYRGESVKGFLFIIDKYSSTASGRLASLYTGNIYLDKDEYQTARGYLESASKSKVDIVKSGASAGLAQISENEGKYDRAAELFLDAANLIGDNELKIRYLYFAAINYEKAGNTDTAEKYYKDIVMDSRRSEFTGLAKANLARLGTIID